MKLHNRPIAPMLAIKLIFTATCILVLTLGTTCLTAQQASTQPQSDTAKAKDEAGESKLPVDSQGVKKKAQEIVGDTKEKVDEIAEQVNKSEKAQEYSAGILKPIYQLAEKLSFPTFHWAAFTVMVTGVVSYGLQLVLGKLVVLSKLGLSFTEILSDVLGLAISVIGLVLTTQAAAENSHFTGSPFAVLSATGVGLLAGFVFYLWGQAQEVQAVKGRADKKKN